MNINGLALSNDALMVLRHIGAGPPAGQ